MTQQLPDEKRKQRRHPAYAKAMIRGIPGYIRDISSRGFHIDFLTTPGLDSGNVVTIDIYPEEQTELDSFRSTMEVIWQEQRKPYYSVGFLLSDKAEPQQAQELKKLFESYHEAGWL